MPFTVKKQTIIILIVLTAIAAIPRFYNLGTLGFYGDEETTSFPSRSVAQGLDAKMPSGMPYLRAIPHTWLNAVSARIFGIDKELSYRIPSAILGTLTIPLLFLVVSPFIGRRVAIVTSILLAVSEWHIITSREARMYAPFLFFYIATAFTLIRYATTNERPHTISAAVLFFITASLHLLGIMAIEFIVIPLLFIGLSGRPIVRLLFFASVLAIIAYLFDAYVVADAYSSWRLEQGEMPQLDNGTADNKPTLLPKLLLGFPILTTLLMIIGSGLGFWGARLSQIKDVTKGSLIRNIALYGSAITFGVLSCAGQLYGAGIFALLFLTIHPDNRKDLLAKIRLPLLTISIITFIAVSTYLAQLGPISGIKALVYFPFPYLAYFGQLSPGTFVLFVIMCATLALHKPAKKDISVRVLVIACLLPIIAAGTVSRWGGIRYLIEIYPFFLIIASMGLLTIIIYLINLIQPHNNRYVLTIALVVSLSGILGGHGIPQAIRASTMQYGEPVDAHALGLPFYPDHQAPGYFVRTRLLQNDIVVAEDMLQQRWYAGRVDYWLRDPIASQVFLYKSTDGYLRDIYVGSIAMTHNVMDFVKNIHDQRVWIITSGETIGKHELYLNKEQHDWLTHLENDYGPVFIGRDGESKVYCLNCNTINPKLNEK